MKRRILGAVLALVILAAALAGCGNPNWADTQAPVENAGYTKAETAGETTDGEYAEAVAEEPAGEPESSLYAEEENSREDDESYALSCYDFDPSQENTEEYSQWEEKGFSSVMREPRSTFSADVDTASYANLRRLILEGYSLDELPKGAVRIEEMLNYFTYDYVEPSGNEPFGVTTQISECPWNKEAQLLMIGLKTQEIDYEDAPAANLVFLLDVSGSMGDYDKLPLLQEAFGMLAENLTEKDRISIVTYSNQDKVILKGVPGDKTSRIVGALNGLEAGGGTNGSRGLETAYRIAEENFIKGGNNRVILATDGDLNIGMTSEEELEELITEKKESGVFLSVLGFGTGNIKDNKMETLADKGNGNYSYIDSLREAKKVLSDEMTATLLTICKDVKFQVEFNPAVVTQYRLIGYENRELATEDFTDDTKDAGEIGAGHSVTALYELILKDPLAPVSEDEIAELKYADNYKEERKEMGAESSALEEEWLTIGIRYKKPAEDESSLLQYPVSFDSYTKEPGEDFLFAAAAAEFGLLASHSSFPENASIAHVLLQLDGLELDDEYKAEFEELVKMTVR